MKILKSLNKKNFSILLVFLFVNLKAYAEDKPIDIWNIDKDKIKQNTISEKTVTKNNTEIKKNSASDIFNMQSEKKNNSIEEDKSLTTKEIKIYGLYDPEDYNLDINLWRNSNGDQLKNIITKLNKMNLSDDAAEIMKVTLLTNAYSPEINISEQEFLNLRSEWLIKNSDLTLIEEYLIKNQIINVDTKLTKYLLDQYLSQAKIDKACKILSQNLEPIEDEYLSKFNIYCLIVSEKRDEAQLIFDLKKELGFSDIYFEKKMNYLLGYSSEIEKSISEKSILDFHLAHKTNPDFIFEPKNGTNKLIWKYLSASNLLNSYKEINVLELDKISIIEKATHDKNYLEKDLFEIYKRFQFDINQLLNAKSAYKSLSKIEARALIYQKILLESETTKRLKLLKLLKKLFKNDNINNAFDDELKNFLKKIDPLNIPDNLTSFYYVNIKIEEKEVREIRFNKDVLHQSKIINYFNGDYSKSKIEKDIENYLKKIKKNKKYFFSKKDQILIESLKSDGIKISKKYDDLYEVNEAEVPTDIQVMINNNEKGISLLRIAEVIGQDELEKIDEDTIYFIIRTLNQLNIDLIRNKILLKVLPLKV